MSCCWDFLNQVNIIFMPLTYLDPSLMPSLRPGGEGGAPLGDWYKVSYLHIVLLCYVLKRFCPILTATSDYKFLPLKKCLGAVFVPSTYC